jgi:hypothetical protein
MADVLLVAFLVSVLVCPVAVGQTPSVSPVPSGSPRPDPVGVVAQEIKARVEAIRGLQRLTDVPIRVIGQQEAAADLLEPLTEEDIERIRAEEILLKRIGLLPQELDLLATVEGLLGAEVGGYYRPHEGDIAVVAGLLDQKDVAALRWVLAHEYVHALQDQHFGIEAVKDAAAPGDERAAVIALGEGDAVFLTVAMMLDGALPASPTAAEQAALTDAAGLDALPLLMLREMVFPYLDGMDFLEHHWGIGGWPAIDRIWLDPPISTEQIMHPALYPEEQPIRIQLPDVAGLLGDGWTAGFGSVMGEMRVGVFIAADEWSELPLPAPEGMTLPNADAATGWGGDRIITIDGPEGEWVVVWQTAWDTAQDAEEFADAALVAIDDLAGTHAVIPDIDISGAAPTEQGVLLLVTDHDTTMADVRDALKVTKGYP